MDAEESADRLSGALSRGAVPEYTMGYLDGFLAGSGALLVHDTRLFALVDGWLVEQNDAGFEASLPYLRRTFARFSAPERRALRDRARAMAGADSAAGASPTSRARDAGQPPAGPTPPEQAPPGLDLLDFDPRPWRARRMTADDGRVTRWRLVLGGDGESPTAGGSVLTPHQQALDAALGSLYDEEHAKGADLSGSSPRVTRWLGDIRELFPAPVVTVMQRDALDRLGLRRMLLEPELLDVDRAGHRAGRPAADALRGAPGQGPRRRPERRPPPSSTTSSGASRPQLRAAVNGALDRSRPNPPAARPRHRLGSARSGATCATTSRSTGRSSPRRSSATAAGQRRCAT